ncbi:MAG: hypothetical protein QW197_00240 [Candidatus Aenigmatarchaeota archaeon]
MKVQIHITSERKALLKEDFLKEIENFLDVKINVMDENLEIESENGYNLLKAKEVLEAFCFGFDEEECKKIYKKNYKFETIKIKDFLINKDNRDRLRELKGRVIGERGIFKRNLEELTKSKIIISRNVVGFITSEENLSLLRTAIEMILAGKKHSTVYKFIQKELERRKIGIV